MNDIDIFLFMVIYRLPEGSDFFMKAKIKNNLWQLVILVMLCQPIFVSANLSGAISYLQAQPQDPWITQALVAAGAASVPTSHLTSVSGTLATDYAKTILAIAAVGENPATFGNIDYVAKLKNYQSNNQIGDEGLINDDIWTILALASVGEVNSTESNLAKSFILANQNADGGWGYSVGGDSDTNDTAAAIMALAEAGVTTTDSVITQAVVYLQSLQNDDGGFGWAAGSDSDSGSDAWVISALYKIGQNPASWDKSGNNPITYLESLQDSDGGFWWVEPGTSDFNNKAMTAYAVIALAGKTYPVGYYLNQNEPNLGDYYLRIEGQDGTICDTNVSGNTALEVVQNAAENCNYSFVIEETAFGPYLKKINNEEAAGMSGWMYFVNSISPLVGAADYILSEGDEVLWYYGDWGWQPTRLLVSNNYLETGQDITMTVEYFNGQSWLALEGAIIKGGDQDYLTDVKGQVTAVLANGSYNLFAEKDSFVRSNKEEVSVGQGVAQNIGLVVEIDQGQGTGTGVAGEAIIFEVNPSQLDFGKLGPGSSGSQNLNIINSGTVDLSVVASVSGNLVFRNNLLLDSQPWASYNTGLIVNQNKEISASLTIPATYLGSGVKTGELILWAQAQ